MTMTTNIQESKSKHGWLISLIGAICIWLFILFSPNMARLIWVFTGIFADTDVYYAGDEVLSDIQMTIWYPVYDHFGYRMRDGLPECADNKDEAVVFMIFFIYGVVTGTVGALFQVLAARQEGVFLSLLATAKLVGLWSFIFAVASLSSILTFWIWYASDPCPNTSAIAGILSFSGYIVTFPVVLPVPVIFYFVIGAFLTRSIRHQGRVQ